MRLTASPRSVLALFFDAGRRTPAARRTDRPQLVAFVV